MKILIVGLGSVGQRHATNLRMLLGADLELTAFRARGVQLVIGTDGTARPGDPLAEHDIRAFEDLEAALADGPDAVIVANPTDRHLEVALAAARGGCHLLVEKPISHTADGLEELVRTLEERELVCLVGYQLRFHPGFRALAHTLAEGRIGRLLSGHVEYGEHIADWHPWEDFRRGVSVGAGGGVLLTQIHDLDIASALFGRPRSVYGLGGSRSGLELDVEDTVDVLLDCGGTPVHIHQDLLQRPPVRRYEAVGDGGRAVWDYLGRTFSVSTHDGGAETVDYASLDRNELFLDELRHFLACIAGEESPLVDAREGMVSLEIALAAARSLRTGKPVAP